MYFMNEDASVRAVAAEAIAAGALVAINSDGKAYNANAKTGASQEMPAIGFAETSVTTGQTCEIKTSGRISGASSLTPGSAVYAGEADGTVQDAAPADAGDIIQVVGQAESATVFRIEIELPTETVT